MRWIAGLFLVFLTALCTAAASSPDDGDECGYRTISDGTVFTLTIERSFGPPVTLMLCQRQQSGQSFVLVSVDGRNEFEARAKGKIRLDESVFENLVMLYEEALDYDVKDSTSGLDGSIWCLETQRGFTYSKACFWTPGLETEARSLMGLHKLGTALWQMANLDETSGGLH